MKVAGSCHTLVGMRPEPFLGLLLGLVSGCQSGERAEQRLAVIEVAIEAPDGCRVSIDGTSFSLPKEEKALLARLMLKAKSFPDADIKKDVSVPYKCVGGAIFLAQRAGFQRVGFIAEPPPPPRQ